MPFALPEFDSAPIISASFAVTYIKFNSPTASPLVDLLPMIYVPLTAVLSEISTLFPVALVPCPAIMPLFTLPPFMVTALLLAEPLALFPPKISVRVAFVTLTLFEFALPFWA